MDGGQPPIVGQTCERFAVDWHAERRTAATLDCPYCLERFEAFRALTLHYQGQALEGAFCPSCGSFRWVPYPTAEALERHGRAAEAGIEDSALFDLGIGNSLAAIVDCLAGMMPVAGGFRSLLDVGCGFGLSLLVCRDVLLAPARGIEPSAAAGVGQRILGLPIDRCYLHELRARRGERFDLVTACGVVEHVLDPIAFLGELWQASETAVSFLVPLAEGLTPELPPPRLLSCLAPGSHITLPSEAGLAQAARRVGAAEVYLHRQQELAIAWFSRVPLLRRDEAERQDLAFGGALAAFAADHPTLVEGGLQRLLVLSSQPRHLAWRALFLAFAESRVEALQPGCTAGVAFDPAALPDFAYVTFFVGALAAVARGDVTAQRHRFAAAQRCVRHLKARSPLLSTAATLVEPEIDRRLAALEERDPCQTA